MTTITLTLSPEIEARLRESIALHDSASIRQLLADAFAPTVETLLRQTSESPHTDEFESIADELANDFADSAGSDAIELSGYTISRAGIYEDHP